MSEELAKTTTAPVANVRTLHASTAIAAGGDTYVKELKRWQHLIKSGALPKHIRTPEMAVAIARYGEEFGWGSMRALNAIYIVEGRPSLSAESMLSLVRENMPQASVLPVKMDNTGAVIKARRSPDDDYIEFSFSIDDAKKAGLAGRNVWTKYPADMCWARAASRCCRRLFSDVIHGAYSREEALDVQWSERPRTGNHIPPELLSPEHRAALQNDADIVDAELAEPGSVGEAMELDPPPACDLCGGKDGYHTADCPHFTEGE